MMYDILLGIGGAIVGAIGLFFFGRQSAINKQRKDTLSNIQKAKGVQNEIDSLDADSVHDRATEWVRGKAK